MLRVEVRKLVACLLRTYPESVLLRGAMPRGAAIVPAGLEPLLEARVLVVEEVEFILREAGRYLPPTSAA